MFMVFCINSCQNVSHWSAKSQTIDIKIVACKAHNQNFTLNCLLRIFRIYGTFSSEKKLHSLFLMHLAFLNITKCQEKLTRLKREILHVKFPIVRKFYSKKYFSNRFSGLWVDKPEKDSCIIFVAKFVKVSYTDANKLYILNLESYSIEPFYLCAFLINQNLVTPFGCI